MQVSLVDALLSSCRSLAVPCGDGVSVYSTETGECVVEMHHHRETVTGAVPGRNRLQVILRGGSCGKNGPGNHTLTPNLYNN